MFSGFFSLSEELSEFILFFSILQDMQLNEHHQSSLTPQKQQSVFELEMASTTRCSIFTYTKSIW